MEVINSHRCRYRTNKAKIDANVANIENIYEIRELLKVKRIAGYKLNYALEEIVQNNTCFHMFMDFSEDCRFIKITNRKPLLIRRKSNVSKELSEAKLKKLTKK